MCEFDEHEHLVRSAGGDLKAFEPLVVQYRQKAYQYAISFLKNHHDALDVSQDAFAKAYRSLKTFDLSRPFLPWFMKILRNLCLNRIQKRKRQPDSPGPLDGGEIIEILPSKAEKPYEAMSKSELAHQIQEALDQLPDDHREIVVLRHFEDLSYEDISKIMDIPLGTVMSRLFNARKKLGVILTKDKKSSNQVNK